MKGKYTLIYFRGCPVTDQARELLKEVGILYNEVCQDELPAGHNLRRYSSPTLLRNEELIFGVRLDSEARACTSELPTEYQLLTRLVDPDNHEQKEAKPLTGERP